MKAPAFVLLVASAAASPLGDIALPKMESKEWVMVDGRAVHPLRAVQIAEINAKKSTWRAGVNERFGRTAPGSSRSMNGVKFGEQEMTKQVHLRTGALSLFVPKDATLAIPESFDAAEQWPQCAAMINDIRDQSNCGCCWAFAGAEAASDRLCIATNAETVVPLSAQDTCFNSNRDGCNGGQIITPFHYLATQGIVSGGQYNASGPFAKQQLCSDFSLPHCHHHGPQKDDPYPAEGDAGCPSQTSPPGPTTCDDATANSDSAHANFESDKYFADKYAIAQGEEMIQRFIMESGPVETAFTVFDDFEVYESGVYQHLTGKSAGGHAVKIVGWGVTDDGVKYWKINNSWNPWWGEAGSWRHLRGVNECGIENEVTATATDANWSWGPVGETVALA